MDGRSTAVKTGRVIGGRLDCSKCFKPRDGRNYYCAACMVEYRKNHRYYKCTSCGTALDATREPKCAPCKRTRDRDYHLKSTYGMTSREYEEMLKTQGGGCAVCGSKEKSSGRDYLHVDHDHITGVVRSILCHRCNVTVGLLREDPIHAELVLGYIKGLQAISACSTK